MCWLWFAVSVASWCCSGIVLVGCVWAVSRWCPSHVSGGFVASRWCSARGCYGVPVMLRWCPGVVLVVFWSCPGGAPIPFLVMPCCLVGGAPLVDLRCEFCDFESVLGALWLDEPPDW